MNKKLILIFIIFTVLGVGGFAAAAGKGQKTYKNLNEFARCLAEKKVTMYGANSCVHCQRQKAVFGEFFELVPYVECPENIQVCLDAKINGYPTWIFADGKRLEGEQELEKLAASSGCNLE